MRARILFDRSVNLLSGCLAMLAQRLPFVKNLSPLLGVGSGVPVAAPLTVSFVGTQALSGQSVTIVPLNGASTPADTSVGEPFQWAFKSSEGNPQSIKVEVETLDGWVEGPPPGLQVTSRSLIWFLEGVPEEEGDYEVRITAYEWENFEGVESFPYFLTLRVGEEVTPFGEFVARFWAGDDLDNEAIAGPNADPDGDGIENVLEFVLDLDPTRQDVMPGVFGIDQESSGLLRYEIPLNALAGEATVGFEESGSGNPSDWTAVPAEHVTRTEEKIVLSMPLNEERRLYRLKVSL